MAQVRCPTCENKFDTAQTKAMPFCSDRCRQIDMGRWLREQHSVPVIERDDEEVGYDEERAESYE